MSRHFRGGQWPGAASKARYGVATAVRGGRRPTPRLRGQPHLHDGEQVREVVINCTLSGAVPELDTLAGLASGDGGRARVGNTPRPLAAGPHGARRRSRSVTRAHQWCWARRHGRAVRRRRGRPAAARCGWWCGHRGRCRSHAPQREEVAQLQWLRPRYVVPASPAELTAPSGTARKCHGCLGSSFLPGPRPFCGGAAMFKKKAKEPEKKVGRGATAAPGSWGSGMDSWGCRLPRRAPALPHLMAPTRRRADSQTCWSGSGSAGRKRSGGQRGRARMTKLTRRRRGGSAGTRPGRPKRPRRPK